jgi:hypothetical protein
MSEPLDVEALAAALTKAGWIVPGADLLTAAQVAGWLQVSEDWVRAHAGELRGITLGETAQRPTLRFSRKRILEYLDRQSLDDGQPEPVRQAPRKRQASGDVPLLAIKGDEARSTGVGSGEKRAGGARTPQPRHRSGAPDAAAA